MDFFNQEPLEVVEALETSCENGLDEAQVTRVHQSYLSRATSITTQLNNQSIK